MTAQLITLPLWQKLAAIAAVVTLGLTVAVGVVAYGRARSVVVTPKSPTITQDNSPQPSPTPDPDRDRVIALLGYGGGQHAGGRLTDTMILAVIQPKQQRVILVSLPRDIWVELPLKPTELVGSKLNSAYSYGLDTRRYLERPPEFTGNAGGGQLAKYAIKQVTGIQPEYFVAVDFEGFVKAIDNFGGVTVNVARPFIDEWYPIEGKENDTCEKSPEELAAVATLSGTLAEQAFPCRYEKLEFLAGRQQMDGATALKYVRSRHSNQDGGDLGRAARQRAVVVALKDKIFKLEAVPKLPGLLTTLSWHVSTDLPLAEWDDWLQRADDLQHYHITSLVIDDKTQLKASKSSDGQFILVPRQGDWSAVQAWLQSELASPPASDSATQLQ